MTAESPANTDSAEIQKFDAMAAGWWDPDGDFKPLHELNPLRLGFVQKEIELDGSQVLDVGCGGGILSEAMARCGAEVTGVDLAADALAVAEAHAADQGVAVSYICQAIGEFANSHAGQFDVVTCMELLEHVPEPGQLVADCAQALRPGGTVFFSTINRTPRAYALAVVGAEYLLRLLPRGTHDYDRFIRPSELGEFARQAGLNLGRLRGIHYNPLTMAHALNTDVGVNYLLSAHKPE